MICVSSCVHTPLISASQETYSYNTNNIRISSKLTIFLADSLDVIHCKQMCAQNINVTGQKSNFYLNVAIDRVIYVSLCYILDFCSFFFSVAPLWIFFLFFFFFGQKALARNCQAKVHIYNVHGRISMQFFLCRQ